MVTIWFNSTGCVLNTHIYCVILIATRIMHSIFQKDYIVERHTRMYVCVLNCFFNFLQTLMYYLGTSIVMFLILITLIKIKDNNEQHWLYCYLINSQIYGACNHLLGFGSDLFFYYIKSNGFHTHLWCVCVCLYSHSTVSRVGLSVNIKSGTSQETWFELYILQGIIHARIRSTTQNSAAKMCTTFSFQYSLKLV